MIYYIIIAVWLIGAVIAYQLIKGWDNSKAEKVWYSIVWPVLIPLYVIHKIHMMAK